MAEENQREGSLTRPIIDRRHWATRIGVPLNHLKAPAFKELYPFDSRLFNLNKYSYHYLDEGNGEPVVMLHGNPTWSFFYRNLVKGLRDQYRCLVPDHLGSGLSEKPRRYNYNLANHIANLESWLEAVLPPRSWAGGRINLVVHDWGGPIGFGYAVRNPDRILRLIVMNTSIFTSGSMPWSIRLCRLPYLGAFMVRGLNLFVGEATVRTTVRSMPGKTRSGYLLPYNSWKNLIGVHSFIKDIPLDPYSPTRRLFNKIQESAPEKLGRKPMLIQWGMKDWCFTPAFLQLWRQNFPGAVVDEHPAGHYLLEDSGEKILANLREFLKRPAP